MDKLAIVTFGRGVIYYLISITIVILSVFAYRSLYPVKCTGQCIGDGLEYFLLPLLSTPVFWFIYTFVMNSRCPGSGYLLWVYMLINVVHYMASYEVMVRPMEKRRGVLIKKKVSSNHKRREEAIKEFNKVITQLREARDRHSKHLKYSTLVYFGLFMLVLSVYKCY